MHEYRGYRFTLYPDNRPGSLGFEENWAGYPGIGSRRSPAAVASTAWERFKITESRALEPVIVGVRGVRLSSLPPAFSRRLTKVEPGGTPAAALKGRPHFGYIMTLQREGGFYEGANLHRLRERPVGRANVESCRSGQSVVKEISTGIDGADHCSNICPIHLFLPVA